MKVFILSIGNEVLSGKIINTNARFLGLQLEKMGFTVVKIVTIGDDALILDREITEFKNSCNDVIITTGGLGPTHDDLTKEVIFKNLGLETVKHQEAIDLLNEYFIDGYPECNLKQTLFPKDAILLPNKLGTAMGAVIEQDHKTYCLLVGPPFEMEPMFINYLSGYLAKKLEKDSNDHQKIIAEYIMMGIGESQVEEIIKKHSQDFLGVAIEPYASIGKIRCQITGLKKDLERFNLSCDRFEDLFKEYIISYDDEAIEEKVHQELRRLGYVISFGESCTGGLLASKLINVSGISNVFGASYVTYSEKSKIEILGVNKKTIEQFGCVSLEVIKEMAFGLKRISGAEVVVVVSGYAGPGGGTQDVPVGTVWSAVLVNQELHTFKKFYKTSRNILRQKATMDIFYQIYNVLRNIK